MTAYGVSRAILAVPIRVVWRIRVEGSANVPAGPVVVVANHDSLSDPIVLAVALERPLRFLAKRELWRSRLAGRLLDALGGIPVERSRGDVGAVRAAARALDDGAAVAIFPQGTVLGSEDRVWHRGAARLALITGAPLVPVALIGTNAVLRPGTWRPRLGRVRVVIGPPIQVAPAPPTIPAGRALTESVRRAVLSLSRV